MEIILSAAVSFLVQFLKNKAKLGEYQTLGVLVALSLVAAVIYDRLVVLGYWQSVAAVLILASSFYSLILSRFTAGSVIGKAIGVKEVKR